MTKRKKILISLFRFPYPASDGTRNKILKSVIEGLATDFDLEFFIVSTEKIEPKNVEYFKNKYGKIHLFKHSKFEMVLRAFCALFSKLPIQARVYIYEDAKKWLRKNINSFDALYVHEIRLTEYLTDINFDKNKIVIDLNDAISLNYSSSLVNIGYFKKLFYSFEFKRVRDYEEKIVNSFKHFVTVSEYDRNYLLKFNKNNSLIHFVCIRLGFAVSENFYREKASDHNIYFIGNLNYEPNRDCIYFLLQQILPEAKKIIPDLSLYIIGGGNIPKKFFSLPGVIFTGFVNDPLPVIEKCSALIAPIRFNGGVPSKILESMSYGIPVVTSKEAVNGIVDLKNHENIILCNITDVHAWCLSLKEILFNSELRNKIGVNAKVFINENYSIYKSQQEFRNLFHEIILRKEPFSS